MPALSKKHWRRDLGSPALFLRGYLSRTRRRPQAVVELRRRTQEGGRWLALTRKTFRREILRVDLSPLEVEHWDAEDWLALLDSAERSLPADAHTL